MILSLKIEKQTRVTLQKLLLEPVFLAGYYWSLGSYSLLFVVFPFQEKESTGVFFGNGQNNLSWEELKFGREGCLYFFLKNERFGMFCKVLNPPLRIKMSMNVFFAHKNATDIVGIS